MSRVGQCFRFDHGGGHVSVRLVVGRLEDNLDGDAVWLLACFSADDRGSTLLERTETEPQMRYLERISSLGGNFSRLW